MLTEKLAIIAVEASLRVNGVLAVNRHCHFGRNSGQFFSHEALGIEGGG